MVNVVVNVLLRRYEFFGVNMSLVSDLKNVDGFFTSTLLVLVLAIIGPGVLTIYLFLPDLFKSLDNIKFILFSVSLSLPIFILNGAFVPSLFPENEHDFQTSGLLTGAISSLISYTCLLVTYWLKIDFEYHLMMLVSIEAVFILFCIVYHYTQVAPLNKNA